MRWGRRRPPVRAPADVTGPRSDFARDHDLAVRLGVLASWAADHGRDLQILNPLTAQSAWVGYSDGGRRRHDPQRGAEALLAIAAHLEAGLPPEAAVERAAEEWVA